MTDENIMVCARAECGETFTPATHNQKYHNSECCRIETNRKIMEKYHESQAIKKGLVRKCKSCGTKLSRYNYDKECASCTSNSLKLAKTDLAMVLASI